ASLDQPETADERRLRHAACLLSDIGWRAHPDYRGEQSVNVITHAAFVGIDHPGRAYLALAIYFRHEGIAPEKASPMLRNLAGPRLFERA
ncbi:exopolyphosphatase, partial [Halomonas sp. ND22Bw]